MKKNILIGCCLLFIIIFQATGWAASSSGVSISGAVRQPIRFTLEDLTKFQSIDVRLNEVDSGKNFQGAFNYRGVPLRSLLELANIHKEEDSFFKFLDVAIVIRNKVGKQVVLSWGEIFYRNPAGIIIAFSASPVMPQQEAGRGKWQNTLNRPIGFPKLVVANDFSIDRCMEEITSIEVVALAPKLKTEKMADTQPSSFTISGEVTTPLPVSDLTAYPRTEVMIKVIGSGRGYQGLEKVSGVPLVKLLEKAGAQMDINMGYLVTHSDGYRAVLSFGELFLDPDGGRILIGDGNDNQGIGKEGRFTLFIPGDLSSDRNVKGIESIEVINMKKSPRVYIISVGCADTSLLTLEAISYLNKTDAVVASEDIYQRYAFYIGHRPVLFDPFKMMMHKSGKGKENEKISHQEREKLKAQRNAEAVKIIREAMNQGKSVALLEYGDPAIYGGFRGINAAFADYEKRIIPGVSAFNAANALIGKEMACKGSIILSSPWSLKENPAMIKSVAKNGDTLAIFMGLKEIGDLIPLLKKYYPGATPVTFAIRAGYSNSKRLIKTTLAKAVEAVDKENEEKESWLGMIYIGSCLE
jgi:precorrin-4 methylase